MRIHLGHGASGNATSMAPFVSERRFGALVCFSYPLHRPGHPELGPRTAHWPAIDCPVLLLSGERDPFARIDLLRAAVAELPDARLITYPGLGHTLRPVLEDVLDRTAAFLTERAGG